MTPFRPSRIPPASPLSLGATWFGSGLLPWMPGTWGSLAALPAAALIHWIFGAWGLMIASVLVSFVGVALANAYEQRSGEKDPQAVVIDEVAGQWLTLVPLGLGFWPYILGFLTFRIFDTLKPWPIRRFERLPGGWGVMADDLVAAVYAGVSAYAIVELIGAL